MILRNTEFWEEQSDQIVSTFGAKKRPDSKRTVSNFWQEYDIVLEGKRKLILTWSKNGYGLNITIYEDGIYTSSLVMDDRAVRTGDIPKMWCNGEVPIYAAQFLYEGLLKMGFSYEAFLLQKTFELVPADYLEI